jgi:hypothetical protein
MQQLTVLASAEVQIEVLVVVVDDVCERREAAIVIESALGVRAQPFER